MYSTKVALFMVVFDFNAFVLMSSVVPILSALNFNDDTLGSREIIRPEALRRSPRDSFYSSSSDISPNFNFADTADTYRFRANIQTNQPSLVDKGSSADVQINIGQSTSDVGDENWIPFDPRPYLDKVDKEGAIFGGTEMDNKGILDVHRTMAVAKAKLYERGDKESNGKDYDDDGDDKKP